MTAIRVDGLGKRYRVVHGDQRSRYRTIRESLVETVAASFRRTARDAATDDFWALNDVSFEVQPGEVIGIIGLNGAGKSTLLKILSRITKPTKGRVELNGRVASLLEVGTGFHPELTGRENIYLNGSILGMSKKEIDQKFDAIVAFAEVERFLDTPVKRYSSGMYVRLAFAVAAYLEPEILIVDEVLAVGDMNFQRKCMQRMGEVGQGGRTILFVSHNMAAVERLCTRAILLDRGRTVTEGDVPSVIGEYNRRALSAQGGSSDAFAGGRKGVFCGLALLDERGASTNFVPLGGAVRLRMELASAEVLTAPQIGIGFDDAAGQRILTIHTPLSEVAIERVAGECAVECRIPNCPLAPGDYWLKVAMVVAGREVDSVERALHISVTNGDAFGEGRGFTRGLCVSPSVWTSHPRREGVIK
jgi:lipopolysaccharide transport system ATP-binding protein